MIYMAYTTLKTVRLEIKHWHGTREKSCRIPNRIWLQAIKHSMTALKLKGQMERC